MGSSIFNRFTNNNGNGSVFHSSGLTDRNTRQIGGGAGNAPSFRSRLAVARNRRIVNNYRDAAVNYAYHQAAGHSKSESDKHTTNTASSEETPTLGARQQVTVERAPSRTASYFRPSFGIDSSGESRSVD